MFAEKVVKWYQLDEKIPADFIKPRVKYGVHLSIVHKLKIMPMSQESQEEKKIVVSKRAMLLIIKAAELGHKNMQSDRETVDTMKLLADRIENGWQFRVV